jgi:Flp pilus assembly secretin CpaC
MFTRYLAPVLGVLVVTPAPTANLVLHLDHNEFAWLPDNVATIVIGNTLIADVSIQPDGLMVFTGKNYGTTNIVMLDSAGSIVMRRVVEVRGPRDDDIVTVHLGTGRATFSCTPKCEPHVADLNPHQQPAE